MRARVLIAIAVALITTTVTPAALADAVTEPRPTWVPDGEVKAITISGSTAYIGGNFSRIAPYTGSSARFDASTAQLKGPWPEVNGVVNAIESDNAGGWYLGGDFRSVGGVPRTDLAHVLADGSIDQNWAPTTNGEVRELVVGASFVVAGGEFSSANGSSRGNLAAFEASNGALTSFSGAVSESSLSDFKGVHAMLLNGTTLYVGGVFDQAVGSNASGARNHVAAFTVANSQLLAWDPNTNHTVNSIGMTGSDLFIGGRFTTVQGVSRSGVAKVDSGTGAALNSWIPPIICCADLTAMAVSSSWVYIGGGNIRFNSMQPALPAAAISVTGAVPSPTWKPTPQGGVTSLAVSGSIVYIGSGSFTDGPQPGLAGVDAIDAAPTSFAPALGRGRQQFPSGGTTGVRAIGVNGSDVVAGGTFTNVGGVDRRNLAAIDLNTGQATGFNPPMRGMFSALTSVSAVAMTDDGLVWAGGEFITEGPNPRTHLAAFDAASGAITSFHRDPNGSGVSALAASGSTVYAGGGFTSVGGTPRRNVAAFRNVPGEDGAVLPFDVDADGPVRALALKGSSVYLGGQFQNVNGALASLLRPRNNLAAVDATTGLALPWNPNADGLVNALAIDGETVFAGGDFATVNGSSARQRLAAFDPENGTARAWAPSADAPVRALAVHGPTVFAGGDFTSVNGGVPRSGFAAFDAQTGALDPVSLDLSTEERSGPLPPVTRVDSLVVSPAAGLFTGGSFVMNAPAPRAANLVLFGLPPLPIGGAGPGGAVPGDDTDPSLGLAASRRRFRVGGRPMPVDGNAIAAERVRKGTTLRLSLSEAARVRFRVFLKRPGRRVGTRCVKPTRTNRNRRRCTRLIRKGTFIRSAPGGRSKVAWSGRIRRKALRRGGYVLRATPTDAAGNTGKARSLSIAIVR